MKKRFSRIMVLAATVAASSVVISQNARAQDIPNALDNWVRFYNTRYDVRTKQSGDQTNPLGIDVKPISVELAAQFGMEPTGLLVADVSPDSQGATANIKPFDIILTVAAQPVSTVDAFNQTVLSMAGTTQPMEVVRARNKMKLDIAFPSVTVRFDREFDKLDRVYSAVNFLEQAKTSRYRLGVSMGIVDDVLRSHLGLAAEHGIVVTDVVADSPAAKVGCEKNDILTELDGQKLTTEEKLRELIQTIKDREVKLGLLRRGKPIEVKITPYLKQDDAVASVEYRTLTPTFLNRVFTAVPEAHIAYELQSAYQPQSAYQKDAIRLPLDSTTEGEADIERSTQIKEIKDMLRVLESKVEALSKP
jgi:S1-C subfamily serine protease